MKTYIFLAEGFEESEVVNPVDVLRRGKVQVDLVSVTGNLLVTSSHGITLKTDVLFGDADFSDGDMLILPGGMPGTINLGNFRPLLDLLLEYNEKGKFVAAICAAPSILGSLGLLKGKKAVCFPGFEDKLTGADVQTVSAVRDGNVITGRSSGNATLFGIELLRALCGDALTNEVVKGIVMP